MDNRGKPQTKPSAEPSHAANAKILHANRTNGGSTDSSSTEFGTTNSVLLTLPAAVRDWFMFKFNIALELSTPKVESLIPQPKLNLIIFSKWQTEYHIYYSNEDELGVHFVAHKQASTILLLLQCWCHFSCAWLLPIHNCTSCIIGLNSSYQGFIVWTTACTICVQFQVGLYSRALSFEWLFGPNNIRASVLGPICHIVHDTVEYDGQHSPVGVLLSAVVLSVSLWPEMLAADLTDLLGI